MSSFGEDSVSHDTTDEEVNHAVTRIQAGYKGMISKRGTQKRIKVQKQNDPVKGYSDNSKFPVIRNDEIKSKHSRI